MKAFSILIAMLIFVAMSAQAQMLAFTSYSHPDNIETTFLHKKHRPDIGKNTKTGLITIGGGMLLTTVGSVLFVTNFGGEQYGGNSNTENIGAAGIICGAVIIAVGALIAIDGSIGDHKAHKRHLKVTAAKLNEIGICYKF